MKVIKLITTLSLALFMAVTATSCLGGNDDYTGQITASDFVTIASYDGQNITFTIKTATGGIVTLYSDQAAKVDQTKFPAGARAYIAYTYQGGQDLNKPVKVSLMSISPVTVIDMNSASEKPDMSYARLSTSRIYCLGDYINMIVSVPKAQDREWSCYFDSSNSLSGVAELYLNTTATNIEPTSEGMALSINVAPLVHGTYRTLKLHVNDQNGDNYAYEIKLSE